MEIAIILFFAVLLIAGGIYQYYQNEKRNAALRELARRHGWTFRGDHDFEIERRYEWFTCLQQGDERLRLQRARRPRARPPGARLRLSL